MNPSSSIVDASLIPTYYRKLKGVGNGVRRKRIIYVYIYRKYGHKTNENKYLGVEKGGCNLVLARLANLLTKPRNKSVGGEREREREKRNGRT